MAGKNGFIILIEVLRFSIVAYETQNDHDHAQEYGPHGNGIRIGCLVFKGKKEEGEKGKNQP
jgi:hypothetical protein